MRKSFVALSMAALTLVSLSTWADDSPAGLWRTIDDHTGKPRALIRIAETNGEFTGKIEKLFPGPGEDQNPRCNRCEKALKDQPLLGMTILSGLKHERGEYGNGQILDPENGKIYQSSVSLADGGKKLRVRGYVGVSMFGRSQIWLREE